MAMICINRERLPKSGLVERVVIQADEEPATMPATGEGVEDLPDAVHIAPASILYALDTGKKYLMDSAGAWQEWTA